MIYLKFELCVRFDKAFINVNRNRVFQTSAKDDQSFGGLFEPVDWRITSWGEGLFIRLKGGTHNLDRRLRNS